MTDPIHSPHPFAAANTDLHTSAISVFNRLHHAPEILFLGNAWDTASALSLERAGFPAVGTTSRGIADGIGAGDGEQVGFDRHVSIVRDMTAHLHVPVSADIEAGYASRFGDIVDNALRMADAGAAGLNVEDSPKDQVGLRDYTEQARLLAQIRHALDTRGFKGLFLNARTDSYLISGLADPLKETLIRAEAYAGSGASGIFVPGLGKDEDIAAAASAITVPLNIMSLPGLTSPSRLHTLGVRRFSFGNALSDKMFAWLDRSAAELWRHRTTASLYEADE
ncbi:isocitrate lyase/PEP mutase family protein [Saccharibacillus deserti]|uniref:isocitrate lyase/PEP mutase family protein n=1 Tax=Saccharibacillus deserti TaxID=1634444 RepID=UPI0015545753|nr:isocitrate lyase/phosphoenolpyruvate mutase family protein [Saccharibacillus deserti]